MAATHRFGRFVPTFACVVMVALPAIVPSAPTPDRSPINTHPRLWVTAADLPRLRSWATSSNPMYQNALLPALNDAIATYNTRFFPGGIANSTWPDTGSTNFELYATEAYAQFFAFMSLIDPNGNARILHAQRARNLLMHAIDEAAKGHANGQPFRDPQFLTYNRGNWWGEAWGLTVDWIYDATDGNSIPILTAADKAKIRLVFMQWSKDLLTAYMHPVPVGVTNTPQLLADKLALRDAANNYFTGHMRNMTLMALSIDPADDPPITPTLPITALGNSIRSYFDNATGAWLYQQYAMYEDAPKVIADYGLPANMTGLGMARGGLSVEGFLYGHALGYLTEALLALHTAGYDDVNLLGPQINLLHSTYWDQMVDGYLQSITPGTYTFYNWMGPVYQMMSYGDLQHFYITPDAFATFGALGTYDYLVGNTARLQKQRWIATNVIQGGAGKLLQRAGNGGIWGNALASDAILYFLLFDPGAPAPQSLPDPRPNLPLTFYAPPIGRLLSRTDWTPNAAWFSFKCGWETINHQIADCGQFEFYRKGEWLTKEHSSYSNDGVVMTVDFHNALGIQNSCTCPSGQPNLQWFEGPTWDRGSQWTNGQNAGDPSVIASWNASYAYAMADATNLYNRPDFWTPANDASDTVHASRSIVWLKPDVIVVYDRATTKTANRFKHFTLNLPFTPAVDTNARLMTEVVSSGQKLYLQSVLPLTATFTITPVGGWGDVAEFDPIRTRLVIEDPSQPKDVLFLNVLQGADADQGPMPSLSIQSISGTPFAGVVVSNTAILFPVTMGRAPTSTVSGAPFTGMTYLVPGDTTGHLITGLDPNAGYDVLTQTAGLNLQVTIVPNGSAAYADDAGVLSLGTQAQNVRRLYLPVMMR